MAQIWDGATWRLTSAPPAPSGNSSTYSAVSCDAATSCLAVGSQSIDFFGFQGAPMAMHWDGTTWTEVTVPRPPGNVSGFSGVSCPATTTCVAVGDVLDPVVIPQTDTPLAALFSHGTWTYAPVPVPAGVTHAALVGVSCPAVKRCTAVGS